MQLLLPSFSKENESEYKNTIYERLLKYVCYNFYCIMATRNTDNVGGMHAYLLQEKNRILFITRRHEMGGMLNLGSIVCGGCRAS